MQINTVILSAVAIEELVSGNQANLSKVEQELEWTIDHKKCFLQNIFYSGWKTPSFG